MSYLSKILIVKVYNKIKMQTNFDHLLTTEYLSSLLAEELDN
jgi:uncharacterized PurR-regulated membrane protein YhhQ (DUF165 family)